MAEVASRRTLTAGAPVQTQTCLMLETCCTKYRKDMLLTEHFTFSVIVPQILQTLVSRRRYIFTANSNVCSPFLKR